MLKKLAAVAAVGMLALCLTGCGTLSDAVTSVTESAQDKVDDLAALAGDDLTSATTLAGKDELNYPAAAQCLPVLQSWLGQIKANADRYKEIKGAVGTIVYKHWAEQTVSRIPENVTLACSAMWTLEKGDFADTLGTVKTLLGK